MRRVLLSADNHRGGGVLTQGAILKVTANGTNTSPVLRGIWVSERLLGLDVPPPPANVPAVEPDIRGATTIRELLAKHRADVSCAACHAKFDPPGYALENYDPTGRWREEYPVVQNGNRTDGTVIDASYELDDGRGFADVAGLVRLLADDPRGLTKGVAARLLTYSTGAPVTYADRQDLDDIAGAVSGHGFGFRSLVSATTFTLAGIMCKIATVLMSQLFFDNKASLQGVAWLGLCVAGATAYTPSPDRKPVETTMLPMAIKS